MADAKPMPQKDRSALRSIIKQRFEILDTQLQQRKQEVQNELQREIESRYETSVKKAVKDTDAFYKKAERIERELNAYLIKTNEKINELVEEGRQFAEEMGTAGLTNSSRDSEVVDPVGNNLRNYLRHNWTGEAYETGVRAISVRNGWKPADLHKKVSEAYRTVTEQAGTHKVDLKMQELEITEELLIGGIASDEGRSFLARVPTIDNLLPAPADAVKVIEA